MEIKPPEPFYYTRKSPEMKAFSWPSGLFFSFSGDEGFGCEKKEMTRILRFIRRFISSPQGSIRAELREEPSGKPPR